jgi:hypothetical protein
MVRIFDATQFTLNASQGKGLGGFRCDFIENETPVADPGCIHLELGVLRSRLGKGSGSPLPTTSSEVELMETK